MRTTVNIDEQLLLSVKEIAQSRGDSVGSVLEDAIRRLLTEATAAKMPFDLVTYGGSGPAPGIDLTRTSQLLEDLDEELPFVKRR